MKREGIFIHTRARSFCSMGFVALSLALSTAALSICGCVSHSNRSAADLPLKVAHLKGKVRWRTENRDWKPLRNGQIIEAGTVIETAQNSMVNLVVSQPPTRDSSLQTASALNRTGMHQAEPALAISGSRDLWLSPGQPGPLIIRVWDNTRLAISQWKCAESNPTKFHINNATLNLQAGHMFLVVAKLPAGAAFNVTLPDCLVSLRSAGYFDMGANGLVKVLQGSVAVTASNISQIVSNKHIFDAHTGALSALPNVDREPMVILLQGEAPL